MKKSALLVCLTAGLTMTPGLHAAVVVQELFDGMGADIAIGGQGVNGSSIGLTGNWVQNAGGTTISTANNFNVDPLPGLPPQQSSVGGVWKGGGGNWGTNIWATQSLSTPIDFNSNATFYFSVRLNNAGDTAAGFGFASGSATNSQFVGVGTHWDNQLDINGVESRNSLYSTWGTLDQDLAGNNDGPYAMRAHTATGSVNGRALVVGRVTTSLAGNDVMDLKLYFNGDTIDNNLNTIAWSLTDSFASSMNATQLLLWINGGGNGELDAIRVGQTWEDVTGVAAIPEPSTSLLGVFALFGLLRRRSR